MFPVVGQYVECVCFELDSLRNDSISARQLIYHPVDWLFSLNLIVVVYLFFICNLFSTLESTS